VSVCMARSGCLNARVEAYEKDEEVLCDAIRE
jgi:hypothetical protein